MKVSYDVVHHKEANSLLFQCIVSFLWALIFWCGYVKCNVLYKGNCLQVTSCLCYIFVGDHVKHGYWCIIWWHIGLEMNNGERRGI